MSSPEIMLDMKSTANVVGCHYDTLRKGWRRLVRDIGFPAPARQRPYAWRPSSLADWQARQEAANRAAVLGTPAPDAAANENHAEPRRPAADRRVDRQRSTLLSLMHGG